jgi:predicted dehydrogenase
MYTFAIVGCGQIARRHAEEIRRVGRLAAVCDTDDERAAELAAAYDAKPYPTLDALLREETGLDVLSICTPNGLHAEHAIKALQAGVHVLCEKPMCITSVAGWQMADTAHFFRRKLFVVKQNRFNEPVRLLRRLLEENRLGMVYSFAVNGFWNRPEDYYRNTWRGSAELDGGILYTQFSHFIDLLYWLLGDLAEVKGFADRRTGKPLAFPDTLALSVRTRSGVPGTLHFSINSFRHNREGSFTLFAEKGTVKIGGQYLNTLEWFDVEGMEAPVVQAATANDYGYYQGSMSNHAQVYDGLVASLDQPATPVLPEAIEAIHTIQMIEQIHAAIREDAGS